MDVYQSFDACVWAREFVALVKEKPEIATDEDTMIAWFASALMRGYDQCLWGTPEYKRLVRRAMYPWWNWKRYFETKESE